MRLQMWHAVSVAVLLVALVPAIELKHEDNMMFLRNHEGHDDAAVKASNSSSNTPQHDDDANPNPIVKKPEKEAEYSSQNELRILHQQLVETQKQLEDLQNGIQAAEDQLKALKSENRKVDKKLDIRIKGVKRKKTAIENQFSNINTKLKQSAVDLDLSEKYLVDTYNTTHIGKKNVHSIDIKAKHALKRVMKELEEWTGKVKMLRRLLRTQKERLEKEQGDADVEPVETDMPESQSSVDQTHHRSNSNKNDTMSEGLEETIRKVRRATAVIREEKDTLEKKLANMSGQFDNDEKEQHKRLIELLFQLKNGPTAESISLLRKDVDELTSSLKEKIGQIDNLKAENLALSTKVDREVENGRSMFDKHILALARYREAVGVTLNASELVANSVKDQTEANRVFEQDQINSPEVNELKCTNCNSTEETT